MSRIRFLIIGAEKTGSTSLFKYMGRHPQIHMPVEKELHFFNLDRTYSRGWDWYLTTVLRGASPDSVCGEAGQYMTRPAYSDSADSKSNELSKSTNDNEPLEEIVPRRIKQFLPDVKLICVLRDPVARAYSEYRMSVLDRVESRSFEETVDQLIEPSVMKDARIAHDRTSGYIVNGEYFRILAGFLHTFAREQLLVIFSDELAKQPAQTLATVFEFIGVATDFVPDNLNTRYREAAVKQRIPGVQLYIWRESLARIRPARALWFALPSRVRAGFSRAYTVTAHQVGLWNAQRGGVVDDDIPSSVRQKLIAHFRPDSEALGDMLGKEIPWLGDWTRG